MKLIFLLLFMASAPAAGIQAQVQDDRGEIKSLLNKFLEGASAGDAQMHDRFWADELIYTSSAGLRFGKAEIMAGFEQEDEYAATEQQERAPVYSAEDVHITVYGDTAVLAFRLVAAEPDTETATTYLNSGTLRRIDGEWRVVMWQATLEAVEE
jgi:ketosteroid isomerase-like protein